MSDKLELEIVTPYGKIFKGEILSVYVPATEGEMGILPGHCDLVFMLKAGVIDIALQGRQNELVAINWGYATINSNFVSIIADGAVSINGSDESIIASNLQKAREILEKASSDTSMLDGAIKKMQDAR